MTSSFDSNQFPVSFIQNTSFSFALDVIYFSQIENVLSTIADIECKQNNLQNKLATFLLHLEFTKVFYFILFSNNQTKLTSVSTLDNQRIFSGKFIAIPRKRKSSQPQVNSSTFNVNF